MRHVFRMDDMDFFEMVNHFFNREREVIQNPLAPGGGSRGAAAGASTDGPTPLLIKKSVRHFEGTFTL